MTEIEEIKDKRDRKIIQKEDNDYYRTHKDELNPPKSSFQKRDIEVELDD